MRTSESSFEKKKETLHFRHSILNEYSAKYYSVVKYPLWMGIYKTVRIKYGILVGYFRLLTSTRPCRIRTNMTNTKCTLQAPGINKFRNADTAIAVPKILEKDRKTGRLLETCDQDSFLPSGGLHPSQKPVEKR